MVGKTRFIKINTDENIKNNLASEMCTCSKPGTTNVPIISRLKTDQHEGCSDSGTRSPVTRGVRPRPGELVRVVSDSELHTPLSLSGWGVILVFDALPHPEQEADSHMGGLWLIQILKR